MIDRTERAIIAETQSGLPLVARPYQAIAEKLGLPATLVEQKIKAMLERGVIRRIGAVPDHYRLGYTVNGMSVWDVEDGLVDEMGELVGALDYVTHCYRRPRRARLWPYNLFAMIHGRTNEEVEDKVDAIAKILGPAQHGHDVLYSKRILKKTGIRLQNQDKQSCSD